MRNVLRRFFGLNLLILAAFLLLFNTTAYSQNCAVNAGVPQSVCESETLTLFGGFVGVSGGAFYWQQISGPSVIIDDPGAQITTVTGIAGPSTLEFRFYALCGDGSIVYDEVAHTILPITQADAGPDQSSCPGNGMITMGANAPTASESGAWSFIGNNAGISIVDPTDPNTSLNLSATSYGTATMVWTISSPSCFTMDTVLVTNCGGEDPVDANRGGNNTINLSSCYTTTQSYTANASHVGNTACGQSGVWNIISGPSIPSINNVNIRNARFSNLIEGTYVLEWCVSGPCASGCDLLTIVVPEPVGDVTNASASGGIYCEGISEAVLTGNAPLYTGESVSWTQTGGPACTIVSPNNPTTAVSGLDGSSTYTFRYTIENSATGCSSNDNASITFTAAPTLSVEADKVLACGTTQTTVSFVATGTGPVSWQILEGPSGNPAYPTYPTAWFNAGSSPVVISDLTVGGSYIIVFRKIEAVGTGCANVYDDIVITVSSSPSLANAGSDQLLACNVDTTFLVGNDPSVTGGGFGTWYQVSKPLGGNDAVIDDPGNYVTKITNLSNGLYVFRWIITGGGPSCPTTQDDVNVAVASTTPTIADAGTDDLICFNTPYQLQGNSVILNETGTWSVTPSSGISFSDPNDPNAWVYGTQMSTAYTFTWTITNACGVTSDDVVITTTNIEGPVEADAGPDGCYPSGTTVIALAANDPAPSSGMWYEVSAPAAFTFDDPTDHNTNINISTDGDYLLEWVTSYNGCTDSRDTVLITVSDPPTPANAGADQILCGDSTVLNATTPIIGTGSWVQVIGPPGVIFSDPTSPSSSVSGLVDGIYGFEWTVVNGACTGGSDTVMVQASIPPDTADAGPDQFICGADFTNMGANPITNNSAYWKLVDGPSTPTFDGFDPFTPVTGMIMGTYIFTWNSVNPPNCPANVDTVQIEVVPVADVQDYMEFCDTISVALNGNQNSNGYWEQVILGAEPVINVIATGNSSAIADSLLPGSGFTDYAFRYVIDYPGCTSADTTFIRVYEKPSVAAAGPDQEFCSASTFTMAGTIPASGTGNWSVLSGPGSGLFVDPTDPTTDFINAVPGVYIFLWTVENGVCNNADPIRVDNWEAPTTANASTSPYQDYYCDSTITMLGNLPAVGVGTWTQKSGPVAAQIVSPILPNSEIRGLAPGTYEFYWTITNGPVCPPSVDSCTIVIATRPTIPEAGDDQEICEVAPVQTNMVANLITTGLGTWTQFSGPNTATIVDPNLNTTLISDMISGTYRFVWTAATDSCSFSDTVDVVVFELPTPADAGNDSVICISDPVNLYAVPATIGIGTWTQLAGPSTASFVDPNDPNTGIFGLTWGNYRFEWRTVNGPCVESVDSVDITISPIPTFSSAGPDQQFCEEDSVRMAGNTPSVGIGSWTQTGGPPCTIVDPASPTTDILYLQYGTSTFRWTITSGACEDYDEVEITRDQLPTMADAGPDVNFCSNVTSTNFQGNIPMVGSGLWTQASGPVVANIVSPMSPTSEVNGLVAGTFEFVWTISTTGVCPDSRDTMRIEISNCAPEVLGANGFPAVNGVISGLATCANNDLVICLEATDPEGDPVDVSQVNILSGSGSTWSDPVVGDTCFTYEPAAGYVGPELLEVIVCDNSVPADCDTVIISLTVTAETVAFAGDDAEICETGSYTIADASASNYSSIAWTSSGDGSFDDPTLVNPTYTPGANDVSAGTVNLTITAGGAGSCPDATDDMILNIDPASTAFAGNDAEICETQTYLIADATASSYDNLLWTSSGTGAFDDPTLVNPTYFPSPNDINDGFVVLTLNTSNGVCSSVSDNMTLTITEQATAYAGADASICEIDLTYTILDALATEYDSLLWSTSGDGSFDDDEILNPTYTIGPNDITSGSVTLSLLAYSGGSCLDATDDMLLNISDQPIVTAGPDDEICETDGSYSLNNASATNATSILWISDGTGSFDDPSLVNPVYTPSLSDIQDGQIILGVTAFGDGICADASDFMILTIWPEAQIYAGVDDTICEGQTFQPLDADGQDYTSLLWTTSGDGSFNDNTLLHPVYTPGPNDIAAGTVVLTVEASGTGTCPNVTDDLTLTILPEPTAFAGVDAEICETGVYSLADATATGFSSLLWTTSGTGTFNDPTALNPVYTPSQNDIDDGFVVLTLTAYSFNPCCPDGSDNMTLTISPLASVYAGADAEICETTASYTVTDATADNYTSLAWTTSGDGSFDDQTILNTTYTPGPNDILSGSAELVLTANAGGSCPASSDTLVLQITAAPSAFAGADAEICETSVSYLIADATAAEYASLMWTTAGDGSFDDASLLNPTYTPGLNDLNNGSVVLTLTAYGNGSCADAVDAMTLTVTTAPSAYAGMDAEICETAGSYMIPDATADNYASLAWTTSGDGSFDDPSILAPTYTPGAGDITAGSVVLTLTAAGNGSCADAVDDMTLTVTAVPSAFAGADAEICETGVYQVLDALAADYSSIMWTTSGSGSFNDPTAIDPVYTPSQNDMDDGFVILTLTAYGNGSCADAVDNMTLSITAQATVYAGADASICETAVNYTIADAMATDYSSLLWTTTGDGSWDDASMQNPTYTIGPGDIAAGMVDLVLTAFPNGSCAAVSDTMTLFISLQPGVYAGPDDEICETQTSYALAFATAGNFTGIQWTTDGTGTFDDPTAVNPVYFPSSSDIQDGQVRLSVTAYGDGICPDVNDEMLLTIWHIADVFAGIDATICEGEDYQLWDATAQYYIDLQWTTSGDGSFDNPAELNPVYTPGPADIAAGSVVLTLTATSEGVCPPVSDDMTLSITASPTVFAGDDAEICETDTYLIADATADNYSSLMWTTGGDGSFDDPTLLNPVYTPGPGDITIGYAVLTLTAYGNTPCPDVSDDMMLMITTAPTAYAGPDDEICETAGSYTLADATASDYAALLWTTSGDGSFDFDDILNPVYTPGTGDIANGSVILTLTAYGNGSCADVSDDMELTITAAPSSYAGPDAEICETDSLILTGATASNYAALMWTTSGDGSFSDPTALNPVYYPGSGDIVFGSAFLTLTAYGNGSCADSTDTMTLTITSAPTAYAGVDAQICETETYVLIDADAENYSGLLWTTSGDGSFDDASILHPEYFPGITDILNGSVDLTLTASGMGSCPDASDVMTLTISPLPTAFAGPDGEMCESEVTYAISGASASGYTSLEWTTDGTGTFSSIFAINPTYTPSQSDIENGQVVLTMNAYGDGYCPDASDFMVLTIWESAVVYAGADAETCENNPYQVLDATAENYISLLWTSSGDGTFDDPAILSPVYTPGSNDIATGSVILTLTAEGMGICPAISDELTLSVTSAAEASAGPDAQICETDVFPLDAASASNYASVTWTSSGDGSFDDPNAVNPVYTPGSGDINLGTVVLTITAYGNGSCGDASDQMTLGIAGAAFAYAGGDAEICEGGDFFIENAIAESFSLIEWSTSGDGSFDDINAINPVYTPGGGDISSGSVVLTITAYGIGSCDDYTDQMTLSISESAIAYAGADADICETDVYELSDATASGYAGITWSTTGDGSFSDPNVINPVYTPGLTDLNLGSVILTMTLEGIGSCEDAVDQMTLQIHTLPVADAGEGGMICYGDEFQISGSDAENYQSLLWTTSGDGSFSDPTILDPVYFAGPADVVAGYAELTLTAYGYGSCGTASDMIVLGVNATPLADAGPDQFIPPGTATQLHGMGSGGSGNYTWSWTPGDYIINSNAQNPTTFEIYQTTAFVLTLTDNLTGCVGTDTVVVFTEDPHLPPVAVDDYDTTYVNVPIVIDILGNDYDPEGGTLTPGLCGGPYNGIATINSDGTLTYTPYDEYVGPDSLCYYVCDDGTPSLCDTAMVYIEVLPLENIDDNLIIYNGFTPNGDGFNDKWIIEGIEFYPDNEVLIFNRWGDIIKEIYGYDNVNAFWNGTNRHNERLPDGTYYYVLKILYDGQEKYYTGWVYVHGVVN